MDLIDIGGDFSNISDESSQNIEAVAPHIIRLLEKHFPNPQVRIIMDGGRYVCESSVLLASQIIGQKVMKTGDHHYYMNGGLYQGYFHRLLSDTIFPVDPVDKSIEDREYHKTTWWGQTCDSTDFITKDVKAPTYNTGEWVVTKDHGAFNSAITCAFNGFDLPAVFYQY